MSTRVGTLQAPRAGRSIWPAAVIASLLMLTIGIGAFFLGRDQGAQAPKTVVAGAEATVVQGTAANTPTEISGGLIAGVSTDTVTAGSSSLAVAAGPEVMAAIIAARDAADAGELGSGTAGNTPSELRGGMFERYGRHQRI